MSVDREEFVSTLASATEAICASHVLVTWHRTNLFFKRLASLNKDLGINGWGSLMFGTTVTIVIVKTIEDNLF